MKTLDMIVEIFFIQEGFSAQFTVVLRFFMNPLDVFFQHNLLSKLFLADFAFVLVLSMLTFDMACKVLLSSKFKAANLTAVFDTFMSNFDVHIESPFCGERFHAIIALKIFFLIVMKRCNVLV